MNDPTAADAEAAEEGTQRRFPLVRLVVSFLLILHLAAVLAPPFRHATQFDDYSLAAVRWEQWFRPYTESLYLHHGYAFFAPNPGPSHLIRYRLRFADGRAPEEGIFPDRSKHSSRLYYHRYFMLSEQLFASYEPPEPPLGLEPDSPGYAVWRANREVFERRMAALESHLQAATGAAEVELMMVEHRLPTIADFVDRKLPLDARELYVDLPDQPAEPLGAPAEGGVPTSGTTGPWRPNPERPWLLNGQGPLRRPPERRLGPESEPAEPLPAEPHEPAEQLPAEPLESLAPAASFESTGPGAGQGRGGAANVTRNQGERRVQ